MENTDMKATSSGSTAVQFPLRLHDILDRAQEEGFHHIISWLPDGKSFQIHDPDSMLPILYRFGFNQSKWKSFLRQLQNYGFHRETRGPDKGICTHELFIRGRRDLCQAMRRMKKSNSADNVRKNSPLRRKQTLNASLSLSSPALPNAAFNYRSTQSNPSNDSLRRGGVTSSLHQEHSKQNATFNLAMGAGGHPLMAPVNDILSPTSTNDILMTRGSTQQEIVRGIEKTLAARRGGFQRNREVEPMAKEVFEPIGSDFFEHEESRQQMNALFLNEASLEETFGS